MSHASLSKNLNSHKIVIEQRELPAEYNEKHIITHSSCEKLWKFYR